ncbi:MAG TPA: substrate-binding and VWA domain-containing protein [Ktedonobacteraceae bacterium]
MFCSNESEREQRFYSPVFVVLCLGLLFLGGCANPFAAGGNATPTAAPGAPYTCADRSSTPVTLTMYYGSEKQVWMTDVVEAFNKQGVSACDGPITVHAVPYGSGESMQAILNGDKADIWSPAGNVWLTLLNQQWQQKYGVRIIGTSAEDNPSLLRSPVVIAMWKPMAQALGWPEKPLGWSDIASLSTSASGWAAYGHPEWGDFKFGHTNPDDSNSGLDAVIAEHYAAVHKQRGLTSADVSASSTREFVANVESSIIHYGESTGTFASEMFRKGSDYLSAAVMYESLVVEANQGQFGALPAPVAAIYPKEGTFYSDHPFAILRASWVTPAKQAAAQAFRAYLLASPQQQKALRYGFRPGAGLSGAPIDAAHGVDPAQPATLLQVPDAAVVNAIENSWNEQRRKVDVMLIIDRSGSMNDPVGGTTKIVGARQGLAEFVNLLGNLDNLGLTQFSGQEQVLSPMSPLGSKRQQVLNAINTITTGGNTRLFDSIADQFQQLRSFQSRHIKAIVVLTDGVDDASGIKLAQLLQQITPGGANAGEGIKIFTIAYGDAHGSGVDVNALTQVASASGGQEYTGTPQNIKQVYLDISKFF